MTSRKAYLIGSKRDRIPRRDLHWNILKAAYGIKLIVISRLKCILFCSLNIFVNPLNAIIRTEIRPLGLLN